MAGFYNKQLSNSHWFGCLHSRDVEENDFHIWSIFALARFDCSRMILYVFETGRRQRTKDRWAILNSIYRREGG